MNKKPRAKKRWTLCDVCYQLVYTAGPGTGIQHECPNVLKAKRDAELDMVIDEELSTWDADVKKFWNSKDVQFLTYLLDLKKDI